MQQQDSLQHSTAAAASLTAAGITAVQERLHRLNYAPGAIDGVYGPLMRAALLAFQADNHLPLTGTVDAATLAALGRAQPRPLAPERVRADAADLRAAGSQTVRQADHTRTAGWIASLLGALGIGNSAMVQIANTSTVPVSGAPAAAPGQATAQLVAFLNQLQTFLTSPAAQHGQEQLNPLRAALRQLQGANITALPSPENAQALAQLRGLIPPDLIARNPELARILQVADSVRQAKPQLQTIVDVLPTFFADGTALNLVSKGLAIAAGSVIPGFGGALAVLGIGLAANYFGNKVIASRVQEHRTAANKGL